MKNNGTANKVTKIIEEIFNSLSHGLGAIAALIGLIIVLLTRSPAGSFKLGFIIYSSSLISLMTVSALYHALKFSRANNVFRVLDHCSIFLLIAGSFTPFIIKLYQGWAQSLLLLSVWLLAATGISVTAAVVMPRAMRKTGASLYIVFGWLGLFLIPKLGLLNASVGRLVLAGGILYTLGTILFAIKKPFMHVGWHFFVIAAAAVQYLAILKLA